MTDSHPTCIKCGDQISEEEIAQVARWCAKAGKPVIVPKVCAVCLWGVLTEPELPADEYLTSEQYRERMRDRVFIETSPSGIELRLMAQLAPSRKP